MQVSTEISFSYSLDTYRDSHMARKRSKVPVCQYLDTGSVKPYDSVPYGIYWHTGAFYLPMHYGTSVVERSFAPHELLVK